MLPARLWRAGRGFDYPGAAAGLGGDVLFSRFGEYCHILPFVCGILAKDLGGPPAAGEGTGGIAYGQDDLASSGSHAAPCGEGVKTREATE